MMRRVLSVVLVLAACAHRGDVAPTAARSADLAVYRAVLDSMFIRHAPGTIRQLVVRDSTSVFKRVAFPSAEFEGFYQLPGVDTTAVRDFEARTRDPHSLKGLAQLGLRIPITLVGVQTLKSLFTQTPSDSTRRHDPDLYWKQFYRTYPGSPGEISLSAIGYGANGDFAILMVDQGCGSLCGNGYMVSVRRTGGEWRVANIQRTWVS
jgi:hypothetical protein